MTVDSREGQRRAVLATALGNILEWFDLILYAVFAVAIGRTFFPSTDPAVSILLALGTFGVAFFMRPFGGIILGSYADRKGRKAALVASTSLMVLGTALIAITPGYQQIGLAAPILVILGRLIQGFSAGGEFASATTFLAEQSTKKKTFYTSWQFATQGLAMTLASLCGIVLPHITSQAAVDAGAWRVPFFLGLLIGPLALFIRARIRETDLFLAATPLDKPLLTTLRNYNWRLGVSVGLVVVATVSIYMFLYMPVYAVSQLGLTLADGATASLACGITMFVVCPIAGRAGDRYGALPLAFTGTICTALLPVPLYAWLTAVPEPGVLIFSQTALACAVSLYLGVLPALLSEAFPVGSRTTAMSISYNIAVMTFGGLAPFAVTWLIGVTGWRAAPSYYVCMAAIITTIALLVFRRLGTSPLMRGPLMRGPLMRGPEC